MSTIERNNIVNLEPALIVTDTQTPSEQAPYLKMSTESSASPIGIANLPNQRHKIVAKRGAAFTIMVAGESGLGKTTFINTLFSTTIKNYADHKRRHQKQVDKTVEIEITKAELEEKFFKGMFGQGATEVLHNQLTFFQSV